MKQLFPFGILNLIPATSYQLLWEVQVVEEEFLGGKSEGLLKSPQAQVEIITHRYSVLTVDKPSFTFEVPARLRQSDLLVMLIKIEGLTGLAAIGTSVCLFASGMLISIHGEVSVSVSEFQWSSGCLGRRGSLRGQRMMIHPREHTIFSSTVYCIHFEAMFIKIQLMYECSADAQE